MNRPGDLEGAWTRRWVSLAGGVPFETQRVVWLQAGSCYADLRVPFHPLAGDRCFAGRSGWDDEGYRWTHRLDLDSVGGAPSPAADDVGHLGWEEGELIERGLFPTPTGAVAYEERWGRLPGPRWPALALEAPGSCLIRAGDHSLTVIDDRANGGGFAACYRVRDGGRWCTVAEIGDGAALPDPDSPPPQWDVVLRDCEVAV